MSFLLLFLLGTVAWLRPVLGYALFMFLQTPLFNLAGKLVHPQLASAILILATIKLLFSHRSRLRGLEICALTLSLIVLLRQCELKQEFGFGPGQCVQLLSLAFLWGPLLVAFNRLSDDEMASLRLWMCMAGIVVGVWGTMVYLTGNEYLMQMAIWGIPDSGDAMSDLTLGDTAWIVKNRFIVMGLFTVIPSAYWYVLRGALVQTRHHWLWNLAMYAGVGTILIAVGISVTRSMILVLSMGTLVMLVAWLSMSGKFNRTRKFAIGITGACLLGFAVCHIDFVVLIEEFQMRFLSLGLDDENVWNRLDNMANVQTYLLQNLCFFGAPGPDPLANCQGSVDTAVILNVWLWYGIPGVILFSALFFTAFWRLLKCWLMQLSAEQKLFRSMLTAWSIYFVYVWIVGYSLHPPEVFFTVLFFSEICRLYDKCQSRALPASP